MPCRLGQSPAVVEEDMQRGDVAVTDHRLGPRGLAHALEQRHQLRAPAAADDGPHRLRVAGVERLLDEGHALLGRVRGLQGLRRFDQAVGMRTRRSDAGEVGPDRRDGRLRIVRRRGRRDDIDEVARFQELPGGGEGGRVGRGRRCGKRRGSGGHERWPWWSGRRLSPRPDRARSTSARHVPCSRRPRHPASRHARPGSTRRPDAHKRREAPHHRGSALAADPRSSHSRRRRDEESFATLSAAAAVLLALPALVPTAMAAGLTPLEQRWIAGMTPVLKQAKADAVPLDVVVAAAGRARRGAAGAGLSRRSLQAGAEPARQSRGRGHADPAAHRSGGRGTGADGRSRTRTLPPLSGRRVVRAAGGFAAARAPEGLSEDSQRAYLSMKSTRREEGYGDLVALAWTARRHPERYARCTAAERRAPARPAAGQSSRHAGVAGTGA
ncbi:hypothetical protein Ddc_19123 [Ditylenchus destructor]|nr:hypothetical protein Ddc_19123 [Ditylenchus destructor]